MNNKCVYLHKTKEGVIFYVGSGTTRRAKQKELSVHNGKATGRGAKYSKYVEELKFEYDVEIVKSGMTVIESISLEQQLFDSYKDTIVNINRPVHERAMTPELFHEHLYLNKNSHSGLSWKTNRYSGKNLRVCRYKAGDPAGYINDNGYWIVRLDKQDYSVHRIIMVLHGNVVDGMVIDHINNDRADNRIENLRIVSNTDNNLNATIRKDNTSGVSGVHFNPKSRVWYCRWTESGVRKVITFSTIKYGFIPAQAMAIKARLEADDRLGNTVNRK